MDPETGEMITLERPLVRNVRIRQHDGAADAERPVVKMWVCIGHLVREVEVNLTARSGVSLPHADRAQRDARLHHRGPGADLSPRVRNATLSELAE
jgi:hypothetical protein